MTKEEKAALLAELKSTPQKERERIISAMREGSESFANSIVNVQAKDVLALVYWIDELRGKESPRE